jgi:hypothetical protein
MVRPVALTLLGRRDLGDPDETAVPRGSDETEL